VVFRNPQDLGHFAHETGPVQQEAGAVDQDEDQVDEEKPEEHSPESGSQEFEGAVHSVLACGHAAHGG
jgi:hypothetical protein